MKKKIDPQDQELIDSLVNKKFPRYSKIRYFFEYSVPGTRSWTHINTLKNRVLLDEGKAYEKKLKKKPLRELLKLQKKETSKVTKPMTTGFSYADIQGETGFPLGLVCWNDLAEELARYSKGDTLSLSGKLQANDYINKQGEAVNGYQLMG
jgi:hypothetical protein